MAEVTAVGLPFKEAVDYFDQKVNVPTRAWPDIRHGAHCRGFTVAGAERDDLLTDLRQAVRKAIADGQPLGQFRKDFDGIVAAHGWAYKGGRNWRTKVIYDTNLRTAWHAGRYAQMTDPAVRNYMPFWRYRHSPHSKVPRPEHLAWDGLVLRWDDPWWKLHYPPNGWGCNCWVEPLSRRDLERLGKSGPDQAPPTEMHPCTLHTSGGPVVIDVPHGVDPGWGYHVGEAAFGRPLAEDVMAAWRAEGGKAWKMMDGGDWASAGRPERLPLASPSVAVGERLHSVEEAEAEITRLLGAPEKVFATPDGSPVLVDAKTLAGHLPLDRTPFLPFLPDLIERPSEVWAFFQEHAGTGQVVLRRRMIKAIALPGGTARRFLLLVAQARRGCLEAWTMIPSTNPKWLQRQRAGTLVWPNVDVPDTAPGAG